MDAAMADAPEQVRPARRRRGTKAAGAIEIELKGGSWPGLPDKQIKPASGWPVRRAIPKLMFDRRVATLAVPKGHARPVLRNSIVAGTFQSYGQSNQVTWRCPAQTHPDCNDGKQIAESDAPLDR